MRKLFFSLLFSITIIILGYVFLIGHPPETPIPQAQAQVGCSTSTGTDIMLVLDTSRSMSIDGGLNKAKAAARSFVNIAMTDPTVRVGIASFDRNGRVNRSFTQFRDDVIATINQLQYPADPAHVGSCLECALDKSASSHDNDVYNAIRTNSALLPPPHNRDQVIVILSDGQVNWWYADQVNPPGPRGAPLDDPTAKNQAEGALRRIHQHFGVDVWVAGYSIKGPESRNYLKRLTRDTEGRYLGSDSTNGLTPIFQTFATQIIAGGDAITGIAYHDSNQNGTHDTTEQLLAGETIHLYENATRTNPRITQTDANGHYEFLGVCNGTKYIQAIPKSSQWSITAPAGGEYTITVNTADTIAKYENRNFGLFRRGSITGMVFIDTNLNGRRDAGEAPFTGQLTFQGTLPSPTVSNGTYTYTNVALGTQTVRLVPPLGYRIISPLNNAYNVTLNMNGTCTIAPPNSQASCVNSVVTNLNFAITQSLPWVQAAGFNIRDDDGFSSDIPSSSACSTYAVRDGNGGTPGIVFSGSGTPDFGQGSASSRNWLVRGGSSTYTPIGGSLLTAYDAMKATLARNNAALRNLNTYCTVSNCTVTDAIFSEPYSTTADLTVNSATITTKKVLIMVEKNLRIRGPIRVSPGAFLMFVVKGNITVDRAVGGTLGAPACPGSGTPQLEGVFSSDKSVIIDGGNACPTGDRQLAAAGSIISNAARTGGQFINNRSLCTDNGQYPSFSITPRYDFLLNAPSYILRTPAEWREVAP